jgi:hypothetical protein
LLHSARKWDGDIQAAHIGVVRCPVVLWGSKEEVVGTEEIVFYDPPTMEKNLHGEKRWFRGAGTQQTFCYCGSLGGRGEDFSCG